MTASRTSARAAVAGVLATALLSGCTASADPQPLPPPPSPTGTPSATPTPTVVPSPTQAPSPTGAALPPPRETGVKGEIERAVLGYYAALNQAFATGDTRTWATTFTTGCTACVRIRNLIDSNTNKGIRGDGLRDEVDALRVVVGTNNTGFANLTVRVPAYRLLDRSGKVTGSYPATTARIGLTTQKVGGRWRVIDAQNEGS